MPHSMITIETEEVQYLVDVSWRLDEEEMPHEFGCEVGHTIADVSLRWVKGVTLKGRGDATKWIGVDWWDKDYANLVGLCQTLLSEQEEDVRKQLVDRGDYREAIESLQRSR